MVRRTLTKEVTLTTVKFSKLVVKDGLPEAEVFEPEILLGNVPLGKAQQLIKQKYGDGVLVFEVNPETRIYDMLIEDFIKVAEVREVAKTK